MVKYLDNNCDKESEMAQLYYRYSTMNAGKSLEIIKVANNYEELGKRVMCLVPEVDDRYEHHDAVHREEHAASD